MSWTTLNDKNNSYMLKKNGMYVYPGYVRTGYVQNVLNVVTEIADKSNTYYVLTETVQDNYYDTDYALFDYVIESYQWTNISDKANVWQSL